MTGHEAYGATTCANVPISAATANGAQSTNPASEAVDNDAATRWSNEGLGSWIRLDLGSQKTVCSVDISWFNGNQRVNTFEIAVSNDGNTFTKIFSSKSSGTTTAAEKYDVPDSQGRYVKITVTGNTQSDWVSINEIDVFGTSSTPLPSDTTKPTVTSTSPGGGTSNIQVNSVIKVTFSEPMSSSSVSTSTFTLRIADTPTTLGGVVSLSSDGKTGSFDPTANLASSTRYVATISTGAKDLAGNALSESKKWSFTTAVAQSDTTPPTVVSTNPSSGASGVPVTSSIAAIFSEPVQSWSGSSIFTVKNGAGTSITGSLALSTDAKTATFKPSSSLGFSTSYTATITTGVKDKAGNAMTGAKSWSFTTVAQSPPPTSSSCDKNAPISAVTANAAQSGNPASAAVDNNLDTRWSNEGLGSWIRLDLGSEKTVCSLD
ncbi:MAG: Ig-like domain-containing protein, partial [Nitrososphaeraceae archaeon]